MRGVKAALKSLAWSVALAVAYALLATLGRYANLGPAPLQPAWLATGLALGAWLLGGWRAAPGLALGLAIAVALRPIEAGTPSSEAGFVAASLGLLTLAEGLLIRALLLPIGLRDEEHATSTPLHFALRVLIGATPAPLLGTLLLRHWQLVDEPEGLFVGLTWWLSDAAGMLMMAPLLLLWRLPDLRRDSAMAVTFPILSIGVGLSLLACSVVGELQRRAEIERFRAASHAVTTELRHQLSLAERDLESLKTYHYKTEITITEFRALSGRLRARTPWIENFASLKRVGTGAATVVRFHWADTPFEILDTGQPDDLHDPVLGPAVQRALGGGVAISASTAPFPHPFEQQLNVLVRLYVPLLPVMGDGPSRHEPTVTGLLSMTLVLRELLRDNPLVAPGSGIDVQLVDPRSGALAGLVWGAQGPQPLQRAAVFAPGALTEAATIAVGDRSWAVYCRPRHGLLWLGPTLLQLIVLACGLSVTGLLSGFMLARRHRDQALRQRSEGLKAEVAARTADLSDAVARLAKEAAQHGRTADELRRFRWFADSAGEGLALCDFQHRLVYANPTLRRMSGWAVSDTLAGKRIDDLYPGEAPGWLAAHILPQLRKQGQWRGTRSTRHPDTGDQKLNDHWFVLHDEEGQPQFIALIRSDITTQSLLQAQLREARQHAEQASQAKSLFLANMSHEIRTPLNAVIGYAQLLGEQQGLEASARQRIRAILDAGRRLLRLINDVLDLSKIEAGTLSLRSEVFDLRQELEELVGMFAPRLEEKRLGFPVRLDLPSPCPVLGDRDKFGQIVLNLLGNALKFTEQGQVSLQAEWKSGQLNLSVQDSGSGIDPQEREALFAPFQQGSEGRQRGGTGLGLALSRRMARVMGGDLSLDSPPEHGTRAHLELPLAAAAAPAVPGTAPAPARIAEGESCHALVVDDDPDSRSVLTQTLEALGCYVSTALDGETALDAYTARRPDVLFTDIRMPGMDGVALLRRLRGGGDLRMPIIAVSASTLEHQRQHYLEQGFTEFISKPFALSEIEGILRRHLSLRWKPEPAADAGELPAAPNQPGLRPALAAQLTNAAHEGDQLALKSLLTEARTELGDTGLWRRLDEAARRYDFDTVAQIAEAGITTGTEEPEHVRS